MKKLRRGMWFRGIANVSSAKSSSLEGRGGFKRGALKKVASFDLDMKVARWGPKIARRLRTAGVGWT